MNYWLVKSEPSTYAWEKLVKEKKVTWDGVRNYAARNNLQAMKKGDLVLFYHSNEGLNIVGIAKVLKEHFPDPTIDDPRWVAVELGPNKALKKPVTLEMCKADKILSSMVFVKIGRLSVSPVTPEEFDRVLELSGTK